MSIIYELTAQIEQDEDGRWSAWIDELPGCAAWGYTVDEALQSLQDAAEIYIEDMEAAGEDVPEGNLRVVEAQHTTVTT